jgi:hypothetical protein
VDHYAALHWSENLDRQRKRIAHAALGLYHSRHGRVGLELSPEPKDLHIYATIKCVFMNAGRLQELFAGQRALRHVKQSGQQCVLTFC